MISGDRHVVVDDNRQSWRCVGSPPDYKSHKPVKFLLHPTSTGRTRQGKCPTCQLHFVSFVAPAPPAPPSGWRKEWGDPPGPGGGQPS